MSVLSSPSTTLRENRVIEKIRQLAKVRVSSVPSFSFLSFLPIHSVEWCWWEGRGGDGKNVLEIVPLRGQIFTCISVTFGILACVI